MQVASKAGYATGSSLSERECLKVSSSAILSGRSTSGIRQKVQSIALCKAAMFSYNSRTPLPAKTGRQQRDGMTETVLPVLRPTGSPLQ